MSALRIWEQQWCEKGRWSFLCEVVVTLPLCQLSRECWMLFCHSVRCRHSFPVTHLFLVAKDPGEKRYLGKEYAGKEGIANSTALCPC